MKKLLLIFATILLTQTILTAQQPIKELENWAVQQTEGYSAGEVVEFLNGGRGIGDITYGSEYVFRNWGSNFISTTKLDEQHFIVAYNGSNGRGVAKVGTIASNVISYSSEFTFNSESVEYISATTLNATSFVIAYQDFLGASRYGTAIVGTVSGNTISFSSKYIFNAGKTHDCSASTMDETHFVVAYRDQDNFYSGTSIIGTVSGNTITYGSEYIFDAVGAYDISTEVLDANHFIIAYRGTNASHGVAIIGSVTGDQITLGSSQVFNPGFTQYCSVTAINANRFVIAYRDSGNSNMGTSIVGSVTGNIITLGAEYVFNSVTTDRISIITMDSTHFIVNYQNENNSNYGSSITGTIVNDSIIYGNVTDFNSGTTYRVSATNINTSKFIVAYQNGDNSNYCTSIIGEVELESSSLNDSLVGYWNFDDGTANDNSGNGHNGTVHGSVPFTTGNYGKYITFNGDYNNYIQIPHHSDLNFSGSFSVCAWIKKLGSGTGSAHVISKGRDMLSDYYMYSGGRSFTFRYTNTWGAPNSSVHVYDSIFTLNEWHYVACVVDTTNMMTSYYLNGILMDQDTIDQAFNITTTYPLVFGRHFTNPTGGSSWPYPCNASIDEVRIYNRALTVSEIWTLGGNSGLSANFTASDTTITLGDTIQFTDLSTGTPTSWQWDFGDGITDTVQNPAHIYQAVGIYSVSLIVSDGVSSDTLAMIDYVTVTQDPQSIALNTGWNIISFNVTPGTLDMINILQPLIDSLNLIKTIDEIGGFIQEIPGFGWMNTIGDMAITEGYYLKVYSNDTLEIDGNIVVQPVYIPLQTGWNIMGYPTQDTTNAITVVQPLIDSSYLIKVIDEAGGFIQEIPGSGWMNTIGDFMPGEGYYIKVTQNCTLTIGREAPTVTTDNATGITHSSATSGGNVTFNGGSPVTARGVCWSTSGNPTLADSYTTDGSGNGAFVSSITGLAANTQYYVRAYATNAEGTGYGNEVAFSTPPPTLATVTTNTVTNITATTATSGGNITSNGGATVTARGVCWSTSSNPTLANSYTIDGTGTGTFTSNLTGLNENSTYYVRAYATNSVGTTYGNEVSFVATQPPFNCGELLTYEGQSYTTVQIGTQCWMAENLNVGTRIDGINNQTNNGTTEKYCYDDDVTNCDTYGGLYQWNEVMQYTTVQGVQGICPNGWHLPTDNEWKTMEMYLGMTQTQANATNWRGNDEGGKLKETGIAHWNSPNTGANK